MGKTSKDKGQTAKGVTKGATNQAKKADAKRKANQLVGIATQLSDSDDEDASTLGSKRPKTDSTQITPPQRVTYAILASTTDRTVVGQVAEYVKIYYYRHHKFIRTDVELNLACLHVWNRLRVENHWAPAEAHPR